ncbi:MAG: hypothetical protein KatS3mg105_1474 [Gemmatales bacterium]|nr:MAG: hypothetical protein KatS3mg105_1474 [Gemmatales bacterium]
MADEHRNHDISRDDEFLREIRRQVLEAREPERARRIEELSKQVSSRPDAPRIVALLAGARELPLRHLTLAAAAHLPVPIQSDLFPILRHLLSEKHVPEPILFALTAKLLSQPGCTRRDQQSILCALIDGLPKTEAVDRLNRLAGMVGPQQAIVELRDRYEQKINVQCPRCPANLPRPEMVKHLWLEHRLLVDGHSLRDPWRLIKQWLEECQQSGDKELVRRCRALAQRFESEDAMIRVHRMILKAGVDDGLSQEALVRLADQKSASLCPYCFHWIEMEASSGLQSLNASRGRLTSGGYVIEVGQRGMRTHLAIETPQGPLQRGPEPGRRWSPQGAAVLFSAPVVVLAVVVALGSFATGVPALLPVAWLLSLAVFLAVFGAFWWRAEADVQNRAIDYAWTRLVPHLQSMEMKKEEFHFAARLCLASVAKGTPSWRREVLARLIEDSETAVANGIVSPEHLGAVRRLQWEDARRSGADPLPLLLEQIERVLAGAISPEFLEKLLEGASLPIGMAARLRALVVDRAFALGYEVSDLVELSRSAPAFGKLLEVNQTDLLANLRLLWSLRANAPWSQLGPASTVFELAANPLAAERHLQKQPGILLAAWDLPDSYVVPGGLVFCGSFIDAWPRTLEVKRGAGLRGYQLVVGNHSFLFDSDPTPAMVQLEKWLRFCFHDFQPLVASVKNWRSSLFPDGYQAQVRRLCSHCRSEVLARRGALGKPADAQQRQRASPR